MINKNNYSVINYKPLLRKKGKRWITVGLSALALLGLGVSSAITNPANVSANSRKPKTHRASHHKAHQHINIKRVNKLRHEHKARHAKFTHKGYRKNRKLVKVAKHTRRAKRSNKKQARKPNMLLSNSASYANSNRQNRTYIAMVKPTYNENDFDVHNRRVDVYLNNENKFVSRFNSKILNTKVINSDNNDSPQARQAMESLVPKGYHINQVALHNAIDNYNSSIVFDIAPNNSVPSNNNNVPRTHIANDDNDYPTLNWKPNANHKLPFNSVKPYSIPKVPANLQNKVVTLNFTDSTGAVSFKKVTLYGNVRDRVDVGKYIPRGFQLMHHQNIAFNGKTYNLKLIPEFLPTREIGTYSNINLIKDGEIGQYKGINFRNLTGLLRGQNLDYVYATHNLVLHKNVLNVGKQRAKGDVFINAGKRTFTAKVIRAFMVHHALRYEVRYNGQTYFMTAKPSYTRDAYYHINNFNQHKVGDYAHVLVHKDAGIYTNGNYDHAKRVGYVYKGEYLKVTDVLNTYNNKTKFLLKDGNVVTANKNYMEMI